MKFASYEVSFILSNAPRAVKRVFSKKPPALEAVARELEKLNEQLAARQARRQAFFRKAAAAAAVFLLVLFLAAVFPNGTCCFTSLGKTCMSGCIELQAKGRVRP